ncbi:MAG: thioredoxin family protein [Candidatus Pedobacter colombiensis]|uniref:Thioredoxin family protein n=1 Tax=Candidatus Pedobacter colombiensis TaxID=3121371 RepID=A0AAJ6B5R3_9SPHI|nr:thioredoxin family protein [Pedobacter sp.]WEK17761.1 MAG: thioredoxin family protein [Pedobacter sp.]
MKLLLIALLSFIPVSLIWNINFNEAQLQAKTSHHQILINFSGSDWCGPCIRLRKEILESEAFETYAKEHLVLVRADFPRQKKNQLPADQVKQNEALAEKYNPDGKFPYTLLIDENGKVLKSWDGYPSNMTPEKFVQEINAYQSGK